MNVWLAIFLFLHVMGAILAFGPVYAFPIIGRMGGAEPQHANFATRVTETIAKQRVTPLAIFQGITGVALILVTGVNLLATPWLLIGIVLYLIVLSYNIFIGAPTVRKVIEMTSTPPPPGASGPPPELLAAISLIQRGGMFSGLMVLIIVFLMVVKPQF
ncbi:MAG TPA: DUF2269 family protein [Candidatus Limnocylindrales bacterium]|jgi:uncharacterized membrane protein|nr:DUF2269 family protein [Candidatus Limnocylindrales bacterium]